MSWRCGKPLAVALAAALLPLSAGGFIPEPERIARAIARANIDAKRDQPLRFDVVLRIDGGPVVAQGELETHPQGYARLELRGADGLRERHLLTRAGRQATRNGARLDEPRAFLPPLFLLQGDSVSQVRTSLAAFGIDAWLIGLAPCGDENCYVVGDPSRVPPPFPAPEGGSESAAPRIAPTAAGSLWLEKEGFDPRRLVSPGGSRVDLGPGVVFESIRVPAWFEIQEPGRPPARFEVQGVSQSRLSPEAYDRAWVMGTPGSSDAVPVRSP